MIIHWVPVYDHRPISWTQPEEDKIIINYMDKEVAVDFSDSLIVEYELELPVLNFVGRAWREEGTLHLEMPCFGNMKEPKIVDHGLDRILTWR